MGKKDVYLTPDGAEKLRSELEHLKNVKRPELSIRLRHAISMGDLSENADYTTAKEDQAFLEGKILDIEAILREAIMIERSGKTDRVEVGSVVRIAEGDQDPLEFHIVGAKEADPRNGRISNESPLGQALIGKQQGEIAVARTPSGEITYTILEILADENQK
jgi:transcription elongation factor GreA